MAVIRGNAEEQVESPLPHGTIARAQPQGGYMMTLTPTKAMAPPRRS